MTLKSGTPVRLVQPEIRGTVTQRRINETTDAIEVLVTYTGADGEAHQRWFAAEEVEEVKA